MLDLHISLLQIGADGLRLLRCHIGDDLQLLLRTASTMPAAAAASSPFILSVLGTMTDLTFLIMLPLAPTRTGPGVPQRLPATAAA